MGLDRVRIKSKKLVAPAASRHQLAPVGPLLLIPGDRRRNIKRCSSAPAPTLIRAVLLRKSTCAIMPITNGTRCATVG
jgi:hypothetical protein